MVCFHTYNSCTNASLTPGSGKCLTFVVSHSLLLSGMIYATVLDNGVLMTAYLKSRGVSEGVLGCSRAFGALFGLCGTVMYPCIRQRCYKRVRSFNQIKDSGHAIARVGTISIWCQWLVLAPLAFVLLVQWACGIVLRISATRTELLPCALIASKASI